RMKPGKPPDVLAERAKEFLKKSGYVDEPADSVFGFVDDVAGFGYIQQKNNKAAPPRGQRDPPAPRTIFYPHRPRAPPPISFFAPWISIADPPIEWSGEALVQLDREGRLRRFEAMPQQQVDSSAQSSPAPDWNLLFTEAGLDPSQWTQASPQWNPKFFADA